MAYCVLYCDDASVLNNKKGIKMSKRPEHYKSHLLINDSQYRCHLEKSQHLYQHFYLISPNLVFPKLT